MIRILKNYCAGLDKWRNGAYLILILFSVFSCSGENSKNSQDSAEGKSPPREISASVYWSYFAQGKLSELRLKEGPPGYLSGNRFVTDASYDFIIAKEKLNDPYEKTQGYLSACFIQTWLLPEKPNPEDWDIRGSPEVIKHETKRIEDAKALIKKYTAHEFQTRGEAQAWLKKNKPYLKFSEEKEMLILVKTEYK